MKYRIESAHSFGKKKITMYETEVPTEEARFAFALLERWGMVAAREAGEDSAGRQQMALTPVNEVVDRAFALAQRAFTVARDNGLMVDIPDLNEINREADAKEEAERTQERGREKVRV